MIRLITLFEIIIALLIITNACSSKNTLTNPEPEFDGIVSQVDSVNFNTGILFYNADQGKRFGTEFNTQSRPYFQGESNVDFVREMNEENPYLKCVSNNKKGSYGIRFSTFKTLFDDFTLPANLSDKITGISFNALGLGEDTLFIKVLDVQKNVLSESQFILEKNRIKSFTYQFNITDAKEIVFYGNSIESVEEQAFGLDDIYLKTGSTKFTPPESDAEFLMWLKKASFNFFEWNYLELPGNKGVVLESNFDKEKVTLSGMGYSYAIYLIAAEDGFITKDEAKKRIESMLNWQIDQNWFDGSGGWHGFPHHYFKLDGTYFWDDVSTIDWAICAAGLRVVKQYFPDDTEIQTKVNTLLARPDWTAAIDQNNKIAMGFEKITGNMNAYRWGLAFSEETELVYLEAVASGQLDETIFSAIIRERKQGFYPSWFGAGFTYNWLQLWTGPIEPFKANSILAYKNDAETSKLAFNSPIMGLTACETIKSTDENGFYNWDIYISNQGGSIHGTTGSVLKISPASYGAALALPFNYDESLQGLREFVNLGFYHEYIGLPDNVRINDLPNEGTRPAPNWNSFDINIGPIILAIEQVQENKIGQFYLKDAVAQNALNELIKSFPN